MSRNYSPYQMPRRYMEGTPAIVRRELIDIIAIIPAAPLDFDIVFRETSENGHSVELTGLDFGADGARGCHFGLDRFQMYAYRERNRRKRVAWKDLPAPTQSAIIQYLEEPV